MTTASVRKPATRPASSPDAATIFSPVRRDTAIYILSPRRVVEALLLAMRLPESAWGRQRVLPLPGITVTVAGMVDALARVAGESVLDHIRWQPDPAIQRIVDTWPARAEARRARNLGFTGDTSFDEILRAHIEDELGGGSHQP